MNVWRADFNRFQFSHFLNKVHSPRSTERVLIYVYNTYKDSKTRSQPEKNATWFVTQVRIKSSPINILIFYQDLIKLFETLSKFMVVLQIRLTSFSKSLYIASPKKTKRTLKLRSCNWDLNGIIQITNVTGEFGPIWVIIGFNFCSAPPCNE